VENCTNIRAKGFVILYANCCANCYYNFNPGETARGERSNCFTPEKSNTFRTHPCKGENSPWKTPTLAETPPKDCKLASNIPTHPGRNLLREEKVQTLVVGMEKSNFRAVSFFLRQHALKFPSLTSTVRVKVRVRVQSHFQVVRMET